MAAFAMIGAAMSGVTFISVPGSVAADSFSYMEMVAGFTVGQFVVAFVLIPLFYRLRVVSLYEYLDDRFGVASHRTGAWFFFISKILGAALRVYVVCAVLQLLVFDRYGLPFWFNALITMAFVWLYTQQGGVKSLIWTDSLKTFCLVASLVLSIVFIMRGLDFSFSDTVREVSSSPMSRIFFFDDPASDRYFWKMFAAGIVLLVCMTGLDQDLMQRNMSCATPRDSQKNIVLTAVSQIVVIFLFLVLGVLLFLIMSRAMKYFKQVFQKYDDMNASVQENVTGIRVVKAYVREDHENKKFQKASQNIYKTFLSAEKILSWNAPLMNFTVYACILLISWLGANMIVGSSLTTGELMNLLTYCMNILMSLMMLSMVFVMITMSTASAERIVKF